MQPSTEWQEHIEPDEEKRFARYAEEIAALSRARERANKGRGRALHLKQHVGARITLSVLPDLPPYASQGVFATPRSFVGYARFSNGSHFSQRDTRPDLRGVAIKLLGVDGPKVLGDASTQDLLFIDRESLAFQSVDEFVSFLHAATRPSRLLWDLSRRHGFLSAVGLIRRVLKMVGGPKRNLSEVSFHTAAAIAFGPYAARMSLVPSRARTTPVSGEANFIAENLRTELESSPIEFDLQAQFFVGDTTPIEDSSVPWPSERTTVARLTVEKRPRIEPELDERVEMMMFDPWHALVAHRPLGSVMRARKHAYFASAQARDTIAETDVA